MNTIEELAAKYREAVEKSDACLIARIQANQAARKAEKDAREAEELASVARANLLKAVLDR